MTWKADLIKYRREKAAKTFEDARFLLEGKRLFSTVNRIYYALFYEIWHQARQENKSYSITESKVDMEPSKVGTERGKVGPVEPKDGNASVVFRKWNATGPFLGPYQ